MQSLKLKIPWISRAFVFSTFSEDTSGLSNTLTASAGKESDSIDLGNFQPSENHTMCVLEDTDDSLSMFVVGGQYNEAPINNQKSNKIRIMNFYEENRTIYSEKPNQFHMRT